MAQEVLQPGSRGLGPGPGYCHPLTGSPSRWLLRVTRGDCAQALPPPVNRNDAKSQFKSFSIELLGELGR